jgi:topoisomerase-4 subunit A
MSDRADDDGQGDGQGGGQDGGAARGVVVAERLTKAIGDRYLTYALSTIMHRALPDARDGLKPVHRRILFAMRELRLAPNGAFRKSAKISGDVMGNYHPHGDGAIYDAMARLAQDFVIRYPLVDGQGNFGNVDGDNPAASRYTEARLTEAAEALLEGLDQDAVDWRDNYDGTLREPIVLPAAFPNLLANGASGIAVGMATSIPPHNLDELVAGCLHLIKAPNASDDKLLDLIPGPDFPTGGLLVEPREGIAEAYRTGRGGFRLRARWHWEDLGRGQWQAVVTEIPYQVPKGKLIEKLAELIQTKKLPVLEDVRDESADDIRIVLVPRSRNVAPEALMGALFRASDLEVRVPLNMNVLIDGLTPKVCSLREVLRAFLDHRREVLLRRSRHRMGKIDHRLEVLEGFLLAYLNLDRVIDIIRYDDAPKDALMHEPWGGAYVRAADEADYRSPLPAAGEPTLSEVQAEAILNMRLRALRRLEEMALTAERDALMEERAALQDLLEDEGAQWKAIAGELREIRRRFGKGTELGRRRTELGEALEAEEVPDEALVPREPVTVVLSRMGWIRALTGHQPLDRELRFKDGDGPAFALHALTSDRLIAWASDGRAFTIPANALPGGRGMGEPLRLMVDLANEAEVVDLFVHDPARRIVLASTAGDGFVTTEGELASQRRAGKAVLSLRGARALPPRPVGGGDHVATVGENRKMLVFPLADLPEMPRGKGVRMQRYKDGGLSDLCVIRLADGLRWRDPAGRLRHQAELGEWLGNRAQAGRMAPRGFPKDNRFAAVPAAGEA